MISKEQNIFSYNLRLLALKTMLLLLLLLLSPYQSAFRLNNFTEDVLRGKNN